MNVYLLSVLVVAMVTTGTVRAADTTSVTAQLRLLLDEEKVLRQSLESRVHSLRQQVANLNRTIVPCVCGAPVPASTQTQVAYTGTTGTSTLSSINTKTDFHFNNDLINIGGAYNASRGHFVAPVDGLYGVSLSVYMSPYYYIRMELVANGTAFLKVQTGHRLYSRYNRQENQGTNFAIVNLTKGMDVWPHYVTGSGTLYGNGVPTFSAFLLHQF